MKKVNPVAFSKENIYSTITAPANIPIASRIADYFVDKFNPSTGRMTGGDMEKRENELKEMVESSIVDRSAITLLNKMVKVVKYTLRTNLYLDDR